MVHRSGLALIFSVFTAALAHGQVASAQSIDADGVVATPSSTTPKRDAPPKLFSFPEVGEYYTGTLELLPNTTQLILKTETGSYPLSSDYTAAANRLTSDIIGEIGAFVGKKVTVRAARYLDGDSAYLAVQAMAPGDSKDFIAGRLYTANNRAFMQMGIHRIFFRESAGRRMKPHANHLATSVGMGDGVIMYGQIHELGSGELEFQPKTYDAWYLMRPRHSRTKRAVGADGKPYRLLGIQTPATSIGTSWGHLEVPASIEFNGIKLGDSRAFVKARQIRGGIKPLFPWKHQSIKLRGSEFSMPVETGTVLGNYRFDDATSLYNMNGRLMKADEIAPGHKAPRKIAKATKSERRTRKFLFNKNPKVRAVKIIVRICNSKIAIGCFTLCLMASLK